MGNKSKKQGRTTPAKSEPTPITPDGPTPISVDPEKVISVLRAKLEASEHRGTVLEIALNDARQELAAMREQFDEFTAALPKEDEVAVPKKKSKEK